MAEPCPAAPSAVSPCTSISPFGGWRCTGGTGHKELHRFGCFRWDAREGVEPVHPQAVENVLRLAARTLLPIAGGPGGTHRSYSLAGLAQLVRDIRCNRYFDVETSVAIESWLAVYEGREASDGR